MMGRAKRRDAGTGAGPFPVSSRFLCCGVRMRVASVITCVAALLTLVAGCTPPGQAVGDTRETDPEVAYDGVDRVDATIALVGSPAATADTLVLDALDRAGLPAVYVSVRDVTDATKAAQDGVSDMVARVANAVIVSDMDASGTAADSWNETLNGAREAGIPIILLNPVAAPADDTLYAAVFTINDRATDATPIDEAVMQVVDDHAHPKQVTVTTLK